MSWCNCATAFTKCDRCGLKIYPSALNKRIEKLQAHADKLAEACEDVAAWALNAHMLAGPLLDALRAAEAYRAHRGRE